MVEDIFKSVEAAIPGEVLTSSTTHSSSQSIDAQPQQSVSDARSIDENRSERSDMRVRNDGVDANTRRVSNECSGWKRYDLRRLRPRLSAHQVRVEELPESDPVSYHDATSHPIRGADWRKAINEEFDAMKVNETWEYISIEDLPKDAKAIDSKWVFRTKLQVDGDVRYKARLVIRGDRQTEGIDFDETFAPVAKLVSLRMLLALTAMHDWELDQMDVVTAFLNPEIDGDVYMKLPQGIHSWRSDIPPNSVCKLRKALYGLKQAPRLWYQHIDAFLQSISLQRCEYDPNVYISSDFEPTVIILLYVDDLLLFSESRSRIDHFKALLKDRFRMTDLGPARQFLGLSIVRDRKSRTLFLHQQTYIENLLARNGLSECNGHWTPMVSGSKLRKIESTPETDCERLSLEDRKRYQSIVGSLMWLMLGTRPDLAFTVSVLSKYNAEPSKEHLAAATYCLRYLRNTSSYGIQFDGDESSSEPIGFTDSDFAGDIDDRKSTSGYVYLLGGGAISWRSRKQPLVAFSTVEAEYIGASDAAKEAIWIRNLFATLRKVKIENRSQTNIRQFADESDENQDERTTPQMLFVDNQGALQLAKNPKFHERTKHIAVRYHFVRDACERDLIQLRYLPTNEMIADILTKSLPREVHWKHMYGLGLVSWDTFELENVSKRMKSI
jgi:hypothetical protein